MGVGCFLTIITHSKKSLGKVLTREILAKEVVVVYVYKRSENGKKLRQNYAKMRSRCQIRRCQSTTVHLWVESNVT